MPSAKRKSKTANREATPDKEKTPPTEGSQTSTKANETPSGAPVLGDLLPYYLKGYSREPFRVVLARFLECPPTAQAIAEFANIHPDRWAIAVKMMAGLAGYSEKHEHHHSIMVEIAQLGDSQLDEELIKTAERLLTYEKGSSEVIDVTPEEPIEVEEANS